MDLFHLFVEASEAFLAPTSEMKGKDQTSCFSAHADRKDSWLRRLRQAPSGTEGPLALWQNRSINAELKVLLDNVLWKMNGCCQTKLLGRALIPNASRKCEQESFFKLGPEEADTF